VGALRIAISAAALLLAGAAPAAAAPGFLGTGHDPGVAVDRAGTAHVAWLTDTGDAGAVEYCRVPRGERACASRRQIPLENDGFGKVQVLLPRPGVVQIVAPLLDPTPLLTSVDGGVTFARRDLGGLPAVEAALYGPGDFISILSDSGPAAFGRWAADGSGPGELPVSFGSATESLSTALAPFGAGFALFFSGSATRSVLWNGVGDPNLQQSWVEGPRLGEGRTEAAAAGGRSGTYVAYVQRRGTRRHTYLRRLRGSGRLGKARRVSREDPTALAFHQGPRGDMALVWGSTDDAYAVRSTRDGRRWTRPRRLFRGNEPSDLRIAVGRRGGWIVWDASAGNTGSNPIRIAALPRAPRR
jgi:hypothetical protein